VGGFSKTVTVTSNAVDNPRVVLRIKGNVKQDAAPAVESQPEMKKEVAPVKAEPKEIKPIRAKKQPMELKPVEKSVSASAAEEKQK
jgi:hypothetical protein